MWIPGLTGGSSRASLDDFVQASIGNRHQRQWTINRAGGGKSDGLTVSAVLVVGVFVIAGIWIWKRK